MSFGAPLFLYALTALPVLIALVGWALARRAASVRRIGDPALIERLSVAASRRMRRGVQVMVALDVSRSMLAQDMKPTRLGRAKLEISDMISQLDGDEVGIVLFSGASFIQFPLTSDYATARTYLNHASPDSITRQGTVIAEAIETAMAGFSHQRAGQKIIVIMTDGENHEGDPIAAAQQAAGEGVVIYSVGFGSPDGEPLPEYDEEGNITGYRRDTQGGVITSKLDEAALQKIAEKGEGRYFQAAERGAIAGLVDQIQSFQDQSLQSEFNQRKVERFQLFLLAGLLSLVLAEALTDRLLFSLRRRQTASAEGTGDV